jgi:hypothetical protein
VGSEMCIRDRAKASTPPSPLGKAPAPSSLAPPKGATGSASSKATAPSPKSKASPSSPKAKALTLTVPKAQSKAQAPVSPRSALTKAMAPKAKASGQHSDGVGRGANLFFWVWLKTTPRIRHFGSRFSLSISGGCGVPAHSCSQHLPTDNEFANHQRHSAPRFKVSFIEKSAGQMGDTTAGPASLLNAMAKAGNPCCACITAVYQSKLDMDGYGRFTIGWFNSPMVSSWDGCAPHF